MRHVLPMAVITGLLASTSFSSAAELGAAKEPIRLAINEWTGQQITTHIAGKILENAGYKVEYVTAGYQNMWRAMSEGQLSAALEVWGSNVTDEYKQMNAAGKIEDLGPLGLEAQEGVAYPPHVAELCPGLPDWNALKNCAAAFATPETLPQGRLVDYPGDWGSPGADRIKALDLPFKAIPAGSEGAEVAEIKTSVERKTPLLIVFWRPQWAFAKYNLQFVHLPKGNPECEKTPSACDFIPTRVFKTAWPGFKAQWPAAYEILKQFTLTTPEQEPMMGAVDVDGHPAEQVSAEWVDKNATAWRPIVIAATK